MKKIFWISALVAIVMFFVGCSQDSGDTTNNYYSNDGSSTSDSSNDSNSGDMTAEQINALLRGPLSATQNATVLKPSLTAPSSSMTVYTVFESSDTKMWLDGTTIYYYAAGYTDSGKGIPLPADCGALLSDCTKLETIDMTGFDTSGVTNMGNMFTRCKNVKSLDVSNWDTSNVTNMYWMFEDLESLTELNIKNFDTSKVTTMNGMFFSCYLLENIDVSNFNTSNVESMNAMFSGCAKLQELDISAWNTNNLKSVIEINDNGWICGMFENCKALEAITVKSGTDWSSLSDETNIMFRGCYSLKGGNNTAYSDEHSGTEYARVDGGTNAPGYFTAK